MPPFAPGALTIPAAGATAASAPRTSFGLPLQPVTRELLELLARAGVPVADILRVTNRFFQKARGTRVQEKQAHWITKAFESEAAILQKCPDDVILLVFALVTPIDRVATLVATGRESFLGTANSEFIGISTAQLDQLSSEAGQHLSRWLWDQPKGVFL